MLTLIYLIRRVTELNSNRVFWPILAKITLICQQPAMPQLSGVHHSSGVPGKMAGGSRDGPVRSGVHVGPTSVSWGQESYSRWYFQMCTMTSQYIVRKKDTWVGVGVFFNLCKCHHHGCLNNPIFSNLGLCAACWAHLMCHHELWPTPVRRHFSFLNRSLCLTGGKYYQKIAIPIVRHVLQIVAIPCCFPHMLCYAIISPYFLNCVLLQ